jgi:hypothetical protein
VNKPVMFEVAVNAAPVAASVSRHSAPGMAAPLMSTSVPFTELEML